MRLLLSVFFLLSIYHVSAQSKFKGQVIDAQTQEPLIGVNLVNTCDGTGTTTDVFGYFVLNQSLTDSCQLKVSYLGYQSIVISPTETTELLVVPLTAGITINELEVVANQDKYQFAENASRVQLSVAQLKQVPNITGEPDVIKALSYTPGISTGFEGSVGLYVRGGSPDQNLILLDDAKIYNGTHIAGFLSSFNSDALSNVELYKGDMPTKFGGRLSSIIDLRVKNGNKKQTAVELSISPLLSKALVEVPIIKDKTSLMVTGRTTFIDLLTLGIKKKFEDGQRTSYTGYTMYDINSKLHHKFSNREQISISYFRSRDKLTIFEPSEVVLNTTSELGVRYENEAVNLKYFKFFNNDFRLNTSASFSSYDSKVISLGNPEDAIFNNGNSGTAVKSFSLLSDVEWYFSKNLDLNFGVQVEREIFEPTRLEFTTPTGEFKEAVDLWNYGKTGNSLALYGSGSWKINNRLKFTGGLRAWYYSITDYNELFLEPRLSAAYQLGKDMGISVAYNRNNQAVHFLSSNGLTLPTDFWMPSVATLPAPQLDQFSIGWSKKISSVFDLKIEGYYKSSRQLITLRDGVDYYAPDLTIDQKLVSGGTGTAMGLELFLEKKTGKLRGWFSYTLSKAEQKFSEINQGNKFPTNYDRRHDLSLNLFYDLGRKWTIQSTVVFATGHPVTLPTAIYILSPPTINPTDPGNAGITTPTLHFEERNNGRLNNYFRVDLGVSKTWKKSTLNFGVYNITGQRNPILQRTYFDTSPFDGLGNTLKQEQTYLFPFLPSISYTYKIK